MAARRKLARSRCTEGGDVKGGATRSCPRIQPSIWAIHKEEIFSDLRAYLTLRVPRKRQEFARSQLFVLAPSSLLVYVVSDLPRIFKCFNLHPDAVGSDLVGRVE